MVLDVSPLLYSYVGRTVNSPKVASTLPRTWPINSRDGRSAGEVDDVELGVKKSQEKPFEKKKIAGKLRFSSFFSPLLR